MLIENECLDSRIKSGEPRVLCKLDIDKAYDYVNWEFLLYLLRRYGFKKKWCSQMVHCICSMRFFVLVIGNPSSFFSSSRSLRQGDCLSPFLFVIVMEALSKMIYITVDEGFLSSFFVESRNSGVVTFHTCYLQMTL